MRAVTLTLGIVQLPTDSVRKVYRTKKNKAKGKVCKSKPTGTRKSPGKSSGGGARKSPAGGAGQKRHRDQSGGRASTPKKRRTAAATEADDMDEHNDGPHLESLDIFCCYQAQGEDMTFESMTKAQRKRIMNQLDDLEEQHQVTLHARETSAGASYADLVVTIVERDASAGAGEGGVWGGDGAVTRAGPSKASAASPVARPVAQTVTGAATAPY